MSQRNVVRRLHKSGLFTYRPECCIPLKIGFRLHYLKWCKEHKNWTSHHWSNVFFTVGSRFSVTRDSQCQLIRREFGSQFHPINITARDYYGGHGVVAWNDIMQRVD
ncbi:transposable element Tcb2 transposase [Trichonephila clavipes]|nr:transposable element Tcb2 transposase [Trichonephila clavipes]